MQPYPIGLANGVRPRALPAPGTAPSHFDRQLDVARRLVPAQAFRNRAAVLLWCGEPSGLLAAEEALRAWWPLDEVHTVGCPVESWAAAFERPPGTASWLRHYVLREVHEREPALLAILDRRGTEGNADVLSARRFTTLLREWGATFPLAVLRVSQGDEIEWVSRPDPRLLGAPWGRGSQVRAQPREA